MDCSQNRQSAKIYFPLKFPAIRYFPVQVFIQCHAVNVQFLPSPLAGTYALSDGVVPALSSAPPTELGECHQLSGSEENSSLHVSKEISLTTLLLHSITGENIIMSAFSSHAYMFEVVPKSVLYYYDCLAACTFTMRLNLHVILYTV